MASYSNDTINKIKEIIDKHTKDSLDNYVRDSIKIIAANKMGETASAIDVADAVFDYIRDNFTGDTYMALACKQICPKETLFMLRNEIIATLK